MASAAVAIRVANTSDPDAQASSSMYAFGDALLFVAVLGLAVAVTGVTAAILFAVGRHVTPSPLATWAGLSVLRILVAPLLALTFLVCTILSPNRSPRFAFRRGREAGASAGASSSECRPSLLGEAAGP